MWKHSLIALLSLAACDGFSLNNGSSSAGSAISSAIPSLALGQTYVPAGPSMTTLNGYDEVKDRQATIQVVSPTQLVVNGVPLTADADGATFRSADGTYVMQVASSIDGVSTDQILYMLAKEQVGGQSLASTYVMGNTTAEADIPKTGTAVYTGKMTVFDDLGNAVTMDGPALTISLQTAKVDGHFTFANVTVSLAETPLTHGTFYTTLASAGATPTVTGTIDGTMFGAGGSQIGGTIGLQYNPDGTPNQSYVGYYGATTP